jgi:hypothetical protein
MGVITAAIKHPLYGQQADREKISKKAYMHISPIIKSTIQDFFIPRFLQAMIIASVTVVVLFYKIIISENDSEAVYNYLGLIALVISLGFSCFIDIPLSVNWQFYSIICFNSKYHIKRSLITLLSIYGIFILFFIFFCMKTNYAPLVLLIAGMLFILLSSVGLAYIIGNILIKAVVALFIICMIVLYFNFNYYILFSLVPILFIYYNARRDFYYWGIM